MNVYKKGGRLYTQTEYGEKMLHSPSELKAQEHGLLASCHTQHERIMCQTLMEKEYRERVALYREWGMA